MKVALLSRAAHPLHPPGGLERAVFDLARHLQALGVETVLVTRPATTGVASKDEAASFPGEVVTVPYGSLPGVPHGRVIDRVLFYPAFARRVGEVTARLVREGRAELVHAQGLTAIGYARERQRDGSLEAPLVMNPQGMEEHKAEGLKGLVLSRLKSLSREAAALSDRVIATDESTRAEVYALLGVSPARIVVLPNGLDLPSVRAATPADPRALITASQGPTVAESDLLFLSVGRLEAYKGVLDTLRALRSLQEARALPPSWAFVIVGEGPLAAAVDAAAEPLRPHVVRTGRASETLLHALYEEADVFVHATRYEGSSLVTLEAMAHARPVVATRAGGLPDKVVPGETGWLVAPGDVAGLAAALLESAQDAARRARFGRAGLELLSARFLWPVIARQTLRLYEELLMEKAA
jgi:glycosyltransferase involved in cell wall biosynthesis